MSKSIVEWLEEQRRLQNGTLDSWTVQFVTEGFYVRVRGGEETISDPSSFLENVSEYKAVEVQLYDRSDLPALKRKDGVTGWDPLTVPTPSGDIVINFNVVEFPHTLIYPMTDERFKNQPWAVKFDMVYPYGAALSLDELSEVMNYLVQMDNLIAFL